MKYDLLRIYSHFLNGEKTSMNIQRIVKYLNDYFLIDQFYILSYKSSAVASKADQIFNNLNQLTTILEKELGI